MKTIANVIACWAVLLGVTLLGTKPQPRESFVPQAVQDVAFKWLQTCGATSLRPEQLERARHITFRQLTDSVLLAHDFIGYWVPPDTTEIADGFQNDANLIVHEMIHVASHSAHPAYEDLYRRCGVR